MSSSCATEEPLQKTSGHCASPPTCSACPGVKLDARGLNESTLHVK